MKKSRVIINIIVIFAILLFVIFVAFSFKFVHDGNNPKATSKVRNTYLMDYGDYKRINTSNIKKITVVRYAEAGEHSKTISDSEEIARTYSYLKHVKLGKETKKACDDNTTVYSFELNDGFKITIVIECDWVVIKDKRYIIK